MKRIFICLLLFAGCKKGSTPVTPVPPVPAPGKATLVYPALNAACTGGSILTDSTSTIVFTWNASANTELYELTVRNLLTRAITTRVVTTNKATDTLILKTPYSWTVKSMSTASTVATQSDTFKFYMSGPGENHYSPFPAALTSPIFNQHVAAGNINLTWTGGDADNDIADYDVYFGAFATPPLYKSKVSDMHLNGITVASGQTYYWKVVTHDTQGNASVSDIYKFTAD